MEKFGIIYRFVIDTIWFIAAILMFVNYKLLSKNKFYEERIRKNADQFLQNQINNIYAIISIKNEPGGLSGKMGNESDGTITRKERNDE